MKRLLSVLMAFAAGIALIASPAVSQPPDGKEGKGGKGRGFKLGSALPPPLVDSLNLTNDQKARLQEIERDLKAKLDKLLTDEQKRMVENFRPGPQGGPGGPGGGQGGPGGQGGRNGPGGKGGNRPPADNPPLY